MKRAWKIAIIGTWIGLAMSAPVYSLTAQESAKLAAQQRAAWANIVAAQLPVFGANGAKVFDQYLRDYPHTRFKHLRGTAFITSDPMAYVFVICGEYDAPNGFGGYDGWKPFELKSPMNGVAEAVRLKNVQAPELKTQDLGYYLIEADCGVRARWIQLDRLDHFANPN